MVLQKIIWPNPEICSEEKLYVHSNMIDDQFNIVCDENKLKTDMNFFNRDRVRIRVQGGAELEKGALLSFDTYFNSFSYNKWKKYTCIRAIKLVLDVEGCFTISLCKKDWIEGNVYKRVLNTFEYELSNRERIILDFPDIGAGMFYFEIKANERTNLYGGCYKDDTIEGNKRDVKIALNICTYKRESYVENNIKCIKKFIIDNPESALYEKLHMFISDNGQTLDIDGLSDDFVHIVKNKNAGGAGGFTRGLIEVLNDDNPYVITHIVMMDDDVVIDTSSLEKTYTLLSIMKEEYLDAFIGGAMLRIDKPNYQVESGASWNAGELISNKNDLNLNVDWDCLVNEIENYTEFNAWWYCCIPMSMVSPTNLPLPLFIRGDDVEYGLRNMKTLILMNGICLWHEPFEYKYSSFLHYYIMRNRLIDNALHFPKWGKNNLRRLLISEFKNESKLYRYKNIELICKGVNDFLQGVNFLLDTDPQKLHALVMSMGYKAVPIEELSITFEDKKYIKDQRVNTIGIKDVIRKMTYNGYLLPAKHNRIVPMYFATQEKVFRAKKVLYYDGSTHKGFECEKSIKELIKAFVLLFKTLVAVRLRYNFAKGDFEKNVYELTNVKFWNHYLELNKK